MSDKSNTRRKPQSKSFQWPRGRRFFLSFAVSDSGKVKMETNASLLEALGLLEGMRAIMRLEVLNAAADKSKEKR